MAEGIVLSASCSSDFVAALASQHITKEDNMIRVVNKRYRHAPMANEVLVYVGRPSVLGNPFPMHNESERDHVIAQYRQWLDAQRRANSAAWQEVERLAQQVASGKSLALQCYCAPRKCHADVIKSAIEYINGGVK